MRVDARGLIAALDALDGKGIELHSLMVARHGSVIAQGWWEPYAADRVHLLYSVSKSWTACAVGALVDRGLLSTQDRIVDLLPGVDPRAVSERWRRVTLGHALTMTVGHDDEGWGPDQVRATMVPAEPGEIDPVVASILAHELDHAPGTHFAYNQAATYLVSSAVRAVSGRSLVEVLGEYILGPLGVPELPWHTTVSGVELGFSGAHARTRDILALAQLHLDEGRYAGGQVLSPEWVRWARTPSPCPTLSMSESPDWRNGYGGSFWSSPNGCYRGDGAFGQFAIVVPDHAVAIAVTSETEDMQWILSALWDHLLPAIDREGSPGADEELAERLASRTLPGPADCAPTPPGQPERTFERVSGSVRHTYSAVTVSPGEDGGSTLTLHRGGDALTCGVHPDRWVEGEWRADGVRLPVAARGGYRPDGSYAVDVRVVETPHTLRVRAGASGGADLSWRIHPLLGDDPLWLAVHPAG